VSDISPVVFCAWIVDGTDAATTIAANAAARKGIIEGDLRRVSSLILILVSSERG
jgi:hypothetical protein